MAHIGLRRVSRAACKQRKAPPCVERSDEDKLSKVLPLRQLQEEIQGDSAIVHILHIKDEERSVKKSKLYTNCVCVCEITLFLCTHHVDVELIEASEGRFCDLPKGEHETNRGEGAFTTRQRPHVTHTIILPARRLYL